MIPWTFCLLPLALNPQQALIDAGRDYPGARVCESTENYTLMVAAQTHAKYQAKWKRQGHQQWKTRKAKLRKKFPGYNFEEICAESWRRDKDKPLYDIGWGMFKAWAYHPTGHWTVASQKHDMFGAGMALGRNGVWYACIIVGDKK